MMRGKVNTLCLAAAVAARAALTILGIASPLTHSPVQRERARGEGGYRTIA
jgi:hypothetical protein